MSTKDLQIKNLNFKTLQNSAELTHGKMNTANRGTCLRVFT